MMFNSKYFLGFSAASLAVVYTHGYCYEPVDLWSEVDDGHAGTCYFKITAGDCDENFDGTVVKFNVDDTLSESCSSKTYSACGFEDASLRCEEGEIVMQLASLDVDIECSVPDSESLFTGTAEKTTIVDGANPGVGFIGTGLSCSNCAPDCDATWVGDGACDAGCNTESCNFDGGDCTNSPNATPPPTCAPGCDEDWPGDGFCDAACNVEACDMDGGDCGGEFEVPEGEADQESDGVLCSSGCTDEMWGNSECDDACNVADCDYDNGDCQIDEITEQPTELATDEPTELATDEPTELATDEPTELATDEPTEPTTDEPTEKTTDLATEQPSDASTNEATTNEPTEASTSESDTNTLDRSENEGDVSDSEPPIGAIVGGTIVGLIVFGAVFIKTKTSLDRKPKDRASSTPVLEKLPHSTGIP